ncbi:hypothetical protein BT69DRAFT_1352911 [Atractiella rhizophila]|nr:hypothetical protein BT69DRAFT_1352911 [Atractiella rhizophila]
MADAGDEMMLDGEEGVEDILQVDSPMDPPIDLLSTPGSPSAPPPPQHDDSSTLPREKRLEYSDQLPYACESLEEMDTRLELIVRRLVECVRAREWEVGWTGWNYRLDCWMGMKYPLPLPLRTRLAALYYEVCVLPGMDPRLIDGAVNMFISLVESKKRLERKDLTLPWKPLYDILSLELFPKNRKTDHTTISASLLLLCEHAQRFFPVTPNTVKEILSTFLPKLEGNHLNSLISTQAFLVHFLPMSERNAIELVLPVVFRLWEAFNTRIWDEQWLDLCARAGERVAKNEAEESGKVEEWEKLREEYGVKREGKDGEGWKDVGIFSEEQWEFICTKLLRGMGVPIGTGRGNIVNVATNDHFSDQKANGTSLLMKKPTDKIQSFSTILVYSMSVDSVAASASIEKGVLTPATGVGTPRLSRTNTSSAGTATNGGVGGNLLVAALAGSGKERDRKKPKKSYVGGSRALDSLNKLVQALESFYHPSNYGDWTRTLTRFLQMVTSTFYRRWMEEQRPKCKTPTGRRITKEIKREFVLTMRTVALLSMFSKDGLSSLAGMAALKNMALLEPDLIFPAILERAYPALENLVETNRTSACLTALASVSQPLVSREAYPAGAKHIVPLLELCIPGLDVNDPNKTVQTCMFILQACGTMKIEDLTRLEGEGESGNVMIDGGGSGGVGIMDGVEEGMSTPALTVNGDVGEVHLTKAQENAAVRVSTAGFPEWVDKFVRQCLNLVSNLPEPGRFSRLGGKSEEKMIHTMIAAMDAVCNHLSPELFDLALDIFYEHCATSVRSNSAKAVGDFVTCFARASPEKTLARFLPLCMRKIKEELEHGAASTRTTSPNSVLDSDVTLSYYSGLMVGSIHHGGVHMLKYKQDIFNLLRLTVEKSMTERAFSYNGRFISNLIVAWTHIWPHDYRFVNSEEWNSSHFAKKHHEMWGKTYKVQDVKIEWHVASQDEINAVIDLFKTIIEPALKNLEDLLRRENSLAKDDFKVFANDFCRYLTIVKNAFQASSDLVDLGLPKKLGKGVTDMWLQEPEFVERVPAFACGINITDPSDPRHTYMLKLRERYGETLHNAIDAFKSHGVEDSIDCVRLLISSIKSILIDYPCDRSTYGHMQRYFDFTKNLCKNWKGQQLYPRAVWIRRALYYHSARQRIYSLARPRSQLEDQLILDLGELSLSPYLKVRLSSQRALDSVTIYYDGSRALLYDTLFDALKPGNDHDRMKGALYVLGSKLFCNLGIVDWRFAPKYITSLLGCHHQERPSVQSLAKGIIHDFIIRLGEPSSLRSSVSSSGVQTAANELEKHTRYGEDKGLIERISGTRAKRVEHRDQAYLDLIPELLKFAQEPGRHWRYRLAAIRFIRTLIRRDMPLNPGTAAFMVNQMVSDIPTIRAHSLAAVTKMLHFLKLRSYASGSSELLLLQKTRNPLKRRVHLDVPVPDDFTDKFIRSLKEPITSGSKEETHLMDKTVIGWLVWGSEVEFYAAPPDGAPFPTWDSTSQAATEELKRVIHSQKWWDDFSAILAQEHTRDYLGNDNATVIKSIFQIFQDAPLEFLFPVLEKFIEEEDRHKQRAAGELLGGLLRGSKHWPKERLQRIWNWLTPRLSKIYDKVTPDTQNSWEMFYDYVLYKRDPRRNLPLIEYVTSLRIDPDSSHAFSQAKAQYLVGSVMKSLSWHFLPWSESYIAEYWDALDNPFSEVRNAVADNLKYLSETRLHPSYTSIPSLVRDCHNSTTGLLLIGQDDALEEKFDQLTEMLKQWRRVRKPSNTGSQRYDNGAMTILNWLFQGLHDFRFAILLPYVLKLLPELFRMQEILDNDELVSMAGNVLGSISTLEFPQHVVRPLFKQLLEIIATSDSWRVKQEVLATLQALYFHNLFLIDDTSVQEIMDLLWELLRDPKIEVREAAATSLSGIVRCSQRQAILMLRERFMAIVKKVKLPARRTAPGYQDLFIMAHSGVLGCAALIDAFPYEVPPWMPDTLISMGEFVSAPAPISTTVKRCLAAFKKSHQDSWQEDQKAFTEEQSMSLRDLLVGGTFYA